ncbi:nuclear transport factor 2 [Protopterus annectens]|uniref:nuclear transport factor 2 n=1 Tax=Protopterus annectens TaxID=7888 RepID=UPI001CFB0E70|nr:nuclear transport factor 2 [Protopterus annectens]
MPVKSTISEWDAVQRASFMGLLQSYSVFDGFSFARCRIVCENLFNIFFVFQNETSCLTWEGEQFQGKIAIVKKITSLPFHEIQHSITSADHQPTAEGCVLSMVVGQLKADEDPIMGFHQVFLLKRVNDAWICTNDLFRLSLHNFAA